MKKKNTHIRDRVSDSLGKLARDKLQHSQYKSVATHPDTGPLYMEFSTKQLQKSNQKTANYNIYHLVLMCDDDLAFEKLHLYLTGPM